MVVSLTGAPSLSVGRIRTLSAVVGTVAGLGFYLYGPTVTPIMQAAAVSECNEMTGGSFRGYALDWVVSTRPHWSCQDRSDPTSEPVNLGWWVTPGS
jgi:hypothetical protein